jgi:hypothetical protein
MNRPSIDGGYRVAIMVTAHTLAVLVLEESSRLIAWAVGQIAAGDARKGTQRDLGGLLALDAAIRAFAAIRSLEVPSPAADLVPERMRQLPLVAAAALDPPEEFVARSITHAVSVSFDKLLGLSDARAGRVLALTVVKSSFRMSAAGQKVLCETAAGETERLRAETATAAGVLRRIAVTSSATGRDHETFLYSGPIDGRSRPFCLERVGRVFSRKAIDAMDNGQLPNAYLTCGGHQCRHTWLPIPHGDRYEGLADTGQLVEPGYAEDVARAPEARARLRAAAGLPPEAADGERTICPGPAAWRDPYRPARRGRRPAKKAEPSP